MYMEGGKVIYINTLTRKLVDTKEFKIQLERVTFWTRSWTFENYIMIIVPVIVLGTICSGCFHGRKFLAEIICGAEFPVEEKPAQDFDGVKVDAFDQEIDSSRM